jgi:electron transfer flavoprotein beta subunit
MRAKKADITMLSASDIEAEMSCVGLPGSPTQVVRVFAPEARGNRVVLEGSLDEQLDQLADKLITYL